MGKCIKNKSQVLKEATYSKVSHYQGNIETIIKILYLEGFCHGQRFRKSTFLKHWILLSIIKLRTSTWLTLSSLKRNGLTY